MIKSGDFLQMHIRVIIRGGHCGGSRWWFKVVGVVVRVLLMGGDDWWSDW